MIKFDYIVVKNLINKKTIKIILNELLRVTKIILASKEKNLNKALNKLSKKEMQYVYNYMQFYLFQNLRIDYSKIKNFKLKIQ